MTPAELTAALDELGHRWGLGRALRPSELGRVVRLPGKDPGQSVRDYESGETRIPGPFSVAVELLLAGGLPPDGLAVLRKAA
jgi:hypothetical protein